MRRYARYLDAHEDYDAGGGSWDMYVCVCGCVRRGQAIVSGGAGRRCENAVFAC
jgi:hypothetical protein